MSWAICSCATVFPFLYERLDRASLDVQIFVGGFITNNTLYLVFMLLFVN